MTMGQGRAAHWIKLNHQCRVPKRWISFDTESKRDRDHGGEKQTWRTGTAWRWAYDKHGMIVQEAGVFRNGVQLWRWVTEFCRPGTRTVIMAHNISHDIRIADAMTILPTLGWRLEWCNLDRNVSSMTWRSDKGTLVFSDLFTWLPMKLEDVGKLVELEKLPMPRSSAGIREWDVYCLGDAEIVMKAMQEIIAFIKGNDLGNWQPTGAGMAYATWRHKFMSHNVLVHDDMDALAAEREAMHTGRAEAWRHGEMKGRIWVEVDMRDAYIRVAQECDMPTKLRYHNGALTKRQYDDLSRCYRVLSLCRVRTTTPVVPVRTGGRILWPVGEFRTWLWNPEVDALIAEGAEVDIQEAYIYTRAPILSAWARWVLATAHDDSGTVPAVIRKWAKHCGRALIGRLSLRSPNWELFGENPENAVGITHTVDMETGEQSRQMHVGEQTFQETGREEGKDSLPQITGYIMSECRVRMWRAMRMAGLENIAHVDTDGMLITAGGLERLAKNYGAGFLDAWQIKGRYTSITVYGPRNYRTGTVRKAAGIPKKAVETAPNRFVGERWSSLAADMGRGQPGVVTVTDATWNATTEDPRREDLRGQPTFTQARRLKD